MSVAFFSKPVWLHGAEEGQDLVLKAATAGCQVTEEGR